MKEIDILADNITNEILDLILTHLSYSDLNVEEDGDDYFWDNESSDMNSEIHSYLTEKVIEKLNNKLNEKYEY
jgi:hypothetical protein